jgi:hypothetical protein
MVSLRPIGLLNAPGHVWECSRCHVHFRYDDDNREHAGQQETRA